MKTRNLIICTLLLMLFGATVEAAYPVTRIIIFTSRGENIELLSKVEPEVKENFSFNMEKLTHEIHKEECMQAKESTFNIEKFIKPEQEVDDINIDTQAIFKALTTGPSKAK